MTKIVQTNEFTEINGVKIKIPRKYRNEPLHVINDEIFIGDSKEWKWNKLSGCFESKKFNIWKMKWEKKTMEKVIE
jgi:hypothetical protein